MAAGGSQDGGPRPPRYRTGYTMFVRSSKLALPAAAGVMALLVAAWPQIESGSGRLALGGDGAAGRHRAENMRFTGTDDRDRQYFVTADAASQSDGEPGRFDLENPRASLVLADGRRAALSSPRGWYRHDRELLRLSGGVVLSHGGDYTATTRSVLVDFRSSRADGDSPVRGEGAAGSVSAGGFSVLDGGGRIVFTGSPRLVLAPRPSGAGG